MASPASASPSTAWQQATPATPARRSSRRSDPHEPQGANMQLTQALTRAAQTRHRHTATIYHDRKRTWGEVAARVPRIAAALRGLGLQRGDRPAVPALNSDNYRSEER